MNLAQSLLEGEAEAWFYRIQKTLIFYSWEELKDKLLLRFDDFADSDRIRLIAEQDRFLQEIRDEARIQRMKTTSIPEKDTIKETITVERYVNQQKIIDEFSENVTEILEEKKLIPQCQVPISSLEPSLSFSSEALDVSQAWQSEIVINNRVHSQAGVGCVKNKNNAHHVFDELLLRRHHVLHDPGGKKDDYSDDIFEAKVDIDNGQRPQVDTVAEFVIITPENVVESVITAPDNVAESVITAPAIVASSSTDAASSTDVITTRQRWDEACDAEIDVLDGTATWIVPSQPANNIEEAPGNRLLALDQKETVSAYVTTFEELSTQVIGLEDSHLEQVFNEGLKTAMQEVLKLTAPVRLENQKKSRCLKASLFNFKRKHKRIKRSHNQQQQQLKRKFTKSWSFKYKGIEEAVDVTQVTLLLQLILDDLKSHMRHKWESKLRLHSGFAGNKLTELDFHLSENQGQEKNNGLLVFSWNLLLLEFFLFIHLEDKVCLSGASNNWWGWLVFDRGKTHIISGDVITRVFLDLKKCFLHGAEKRDVQTMLLVKAKDAHVDSLIVRIKELWMANMVEINTGVFWAELKWIIWSGASWHCSSDGMNQFLSPIRLVDALYSGLGENDHALLAAEVHESGQQQSSSKWHRWRRKDCNFPSSSLRTSLFSGGKVLIRFISRIMGRRSRCQLSKD